MKSIILKTMALILFICLLSACDNAPMLSDVPISYEKQDFDKSLLGKWVVESEYSVGSGYFKYLYFEKVNSKDFRIYGYKFDSLSHTYKTYPFDCFSSDVISNSITSVFIPSRYSALELLPPKFKNLGGYVSFVHTIENNTILYLYFIRAMPFSKKTEKNSNNYPDVIRFKNAIDFRNYLNALPSKVLFNEQPSYKLKKVR